MIFTFHAVVSTGEQPLETGYSRLSILDDRLSLRLRAPTSAVSGHAVGDPCWL
jgi:hypothetical protein